MFLIQCCCSIDNCFVGSGRLELPTYRLRLSPWPSALPTELTTRKMMPSVVHTYLAHRLLVGTSLSPLLLNNLLNTYPDRGLRSGFSRIPLARGLISYYTTNSQQIDIPSLIGFDCGQPLSLPLHARPYWLHNGSVVYLQMQRLIAY